MWSLKNFTGHLLFLFLLATPSEVRAQKEAAIWYFGNNAGLDFGQGSPRPLLDGQVNTIEGSESYSDGSGNLLFYTDGKTVWDRDHQVMANGTELRSSFSTSQAALVVPLPGNDFRYYVFTPDDALIYSELNPGTSNGFNYSVIDMRLNQGRGDVVEKNTDLLENASENVTAVRNFNEDFYWVLTHHIDRYYTYRIDGNGLDPQPVVSITGPEISGSDNIRGNIKISPNGTRMAISHTVLEPDYESHLYVYDFDPETGRVSNPIQLGPSRLYYGVEFSPDSSKLYASGMPIVADGEGKKRLDKVEIVQFNLVSQDVGSSEYLVHRFERSLPGRVSGALQLAIDKKLYHAIPGDYLSVIRSPDNEGIYCDFRPFDTYLGGRASGYGLPPYIQSFFETIVEIDQFCLGQPTEFNIKERSGVQSVIWDFDDPASGALNTSTEFNPSHTFTDYGVFEVRLRVNYENGSSREFLEFLEVAQVPDLRSEITLVQCDIDGVDDGITDFNLRASIDQFNEGNPDINAFYFETRADAETNSNFLPSESYRNLANGQVVYARAYENPDCPAIIEITLETQWVQGYGDVEIVPVCLDKPPTLALEFDTEQVYDYLQIRYPEADSLAVYREEGDALLEREKVGFETIFLGPFDSNRFWYRVENNNSCEYIGAMDLDFKSPPELQEFNEVQLCNGKAILFASEGFDAYLWDDGTTAPVLEVSSPGSYGVNLLQGSCSRRQVFEVGVPENIIIEDIRILDFRSQNSVEVVTSSAAETLSFSLDGGERFQDSPIFEDVLPGIYELLVKDNCNTVEDTVVVGGLPSFFTPNGDGYNDRWQMSVMPAFSDFNIQVFDRYGNLLVVLDENHPGWDGTLRGVDMPSSDYWYRMELPEGRIIQGHFALKR